MIGVCFFSFFFPDLYYSLISLIIRFINIWGLYCYSNFGGLTNGHETFSLEQINQLRLSPPKMKQIQNLPEKKRPRSIVYHKNDIFLQNSPKEHYMLSPLLRLPVFAFNTSIQQIEVFGMSLKKKEKIIHEFQSSYNLHHMHCPEEVYILMLSPVLIPLPPPPRVQVRGLDFSSKADLV